ncbi:hypothetical protein DL93DRAFT_2068155 [Clavulina sp. PMI_390]|nr:hypothetical protein DL93DRAFT_2068155 [Clavulina sp. PMI_390]
MIERGHWTWIESIWKLCKRHKNKWSEWFYAAMWADRVTARRTTGFSPYHLLYGRPHLFPFTLEEETWYTTRWQDVSTTEELLEVRANQLSRLRRDRSLAAKRNIAARRKAAEAYAIHHAHRLSSGKYRPDEFVLVALKGPNVKKGYGRIKAADRWSGPFRIHGRYKSGSYLLKELDGTILKGSIPASHLRPFFTNADQVQGHNLIQPDDLDKDSEPINWLAEEESDDPADSPYVDEG